MTVWMNKEHGNIHFSVKEMLQEARELYDIDEDAYETLDKYLKSMNRYFKKRKGEEEVADEWSLRRT